MEQRLSTFTTQQYQQLEAKELMRVLSALACGRQMGGTPSEFYTARWGSSANPMSSIVTRAFELETKAATSPAVTTDVPWAGALVTNRVSSAFIGLVRQESLLSALPVAMVPFNVPMPYQVSGSSMKWVGEGAPKPATKLGFGNQTLAPTKAAGIVVVSRELMELSMPGSEQALQQILVNEITTFTDAALLSAAAAVAGVSPAGLLNGVTVSTNIATTISAFFTARPAALAPHWIVAPANLGTLSALDPQNVPTRFKGFPVVVSPAAGANLILLDPPVLAVADGEVQLDISNHALIEMVDNPTTPAATQILTSLWSQNLTGIRCERAINWKAATGSVQFTATLT